MPSLKPWQQAVGYILIGMALAAGIFLVSRPPRGEAIILTPVATQEYLVQIDGAVQQPGVYKIAAESRVQDLIDAAGGLTDNAAVGSINLVRPVKDGERITIPATIEKQDPEKSATGTILLDINLATLDDLDALPGIGETRATAILDYRTEHGNFVTLEEIRNVPGITADVYEKIKDLVIIQ